jgi:hypothetical protein
MTLKIFSGIPRVNREARNQCVFAMASIEVQRGAASSPDSEFAKQSDDEVAAVERIVQSGTSSMRVR